MSSPGYWHVQRLSENLGRWVRVGGSAGGRSYAAGWFDALTSFLPRPAYRLVRPDGEVTDECGAAGAPSATPSVPDELADLRPEDLVVTRDAGDEDRVRAGRGR